MSKQKLNNATYSIQQLIKHMPQTAYATSANTQARLTRCVKTLHSLGFKLSHIQGLKTKHVQALVNHWHTQQLSPATIYIDGSAPSNM